MVVKSRSKIVVGVFAIVLFILPNETHLPSVYC